MSTSDSESLDIQSAELQRDMGAHRTKHYVIDQRAFTFQNPHRHKHAMRSSKHTQRLKKPARVFKKTKTPNFKGTKMNLVEIERQTAGLKQLLSEKKTLSEIVSVYHKQYGFCVDFVVSLIASMPRTLPQFVPQIAHKIDTPLRALRGLSVWQYVLRHQPAHIDIARFFYAFGPLVGHYKTVVSPLHLCARKLIECAQGRESHITKTTSPPECVRAFEVFLFLLFAGYDIDDGDIANTITPHTILHSSPRILKQVLSVKRSFLHRQRQCIESVDGVAYKRWGILLDDDILQVIEKSTYNQFRNLKKAVSHKRFAQRAGTGAAVY